MSSLSSRMTCFFKRHSRSLERRNGWISSSHRSRSSHHSRSSPRSPRHCWTPPRGEGHTGCGGSPSLAAPNDTVRCESWGVPFGIWLLGPGWRDAAGTLRPAGSPVCGGQLRGTRRRGRGSTYHHHQLGLSLRDHVRFHIIMDYWKFCDIPTCWSS